MKPALRKQLFDRWKEIETNGFFYEFVHGLELRDRIVHVSVDGYFDAYFTPGTKVLKVIEILGRIPQ